MLKQIKKFFGPTDMLDRIPHSLHEDYEGNRVRLRTFLELLPMDVAIRIGHIDCTDGSLTVTWRCKPTWTQRKLIGVIWDGIFGLPEDLVKHEGETPYHPTTLEDRIHSGMEDAEIAEYESRKNQARELVAKPI